MNKKYPALFSLFALAFAFSANAFAEDLKLSDIISGNGSASATGGGQKTTVSGNAATGNFTTAKAPTQPAPTAPSSNSGAPTDISQVENTVFNGKIFDDTNAPLVGVTVRARSLNSSVPFEAEAVTGSGGTYSINNAPMGVQIEVIASKAGYTTRRRVEVLKSNKQGDPNANRYDFGSDAGSTQFSADYQALSDRPEVTQVSPGRNASGVDPKTSFVVKFSEPMDTDTVEDHFLLRTFGEGESTDFGGDAKALGDLFTGDVAPNGGGIWDDSAFDVNWNSDDTEVTFTFKDERSLPSGDVPDYLVTFHGSDDRCFCDKSGICRNDDFFKLTDGDFESFYKFSIPTEGDPTEGDAFGDNFGPSHFVPNPTPGNFLDPSFGADIFIAPGGPGTFPSSPHGDSLLNDPAFREQRFVELFGGKFFDPNEQPN